MAINDFLFVTYLSMLKTIIKCLIRFNSRQPDATDAILDGFSVAMSVALCKVAQTLNWAHEALLLLLLMSLMIVHVAEVARFRRKLFFRAPVVRRVISRLGRVSGSIILFVPGRF